jgi:hypothetical protein
VFVGDRQPFELVICITMALIGTSFLHRGGNGCGVKVQ